MVNGYVLNNVEGFGVRERERGGGRKSESERQRQRQREAEAGEGGGGEELHIWRGERLSGTELEKERVG